MPTYFLRLLSTLYDMVIPPRPTEALVAALTPAELFPLVGPNGMLPYHDERARALVWEVKYYANKHAAQLGGVLLAEVLMGLAEDTLGKPLLIPVPMHHKRRKKRGHNQTEVLAHGALIHTENMFEYAPNILERIIDTTAQQGLAKHQRLKNVAGSMRVKHPEKVLGRACIVLDDVTTTGATFAEAERALKQAGARSVICVALAQS